MTIGKIFREILAKAYSHISKTHSHISKRAILISAKPYFTHVYNIINNLNLRIFASKHLNNIDNDYTPILFPTYVCLRFLGCTNRMHLIL